jgi:HAD superfamily hydrolase (TIGR01509 family)
MPIARFAARLPVADVPDSALLRPLAVILDMDGVLLDTEPISLRVWRAAAQALGYTLDEETCGLMVGRSQASNREMLAARLGAGCPIDDLVASAQARYREALEREGVPRKPGLERFIAYLDEHQLPRAVATSTHSELAAFKLERAGVLRHFDIIVGGEQVAHGKPMPDIFLAAAERLAVAPARCLVVEDSGPGIQAAVAAGMTAIMIPDRASPIDIRTAAWVVVESLDDARTSIDRLLKS